MIDAPERRTILVKEALLVEWLTVAWMLIEAGVAIGSGVAARSLTLLAFGVDSVIELLSALLLLWRLAVELRRGEDFPKELEERAEKVAAGLLFALSLYVIVNAVWALRQRNAQTFSPTGLVLAALAIPIMYAFAKAKLRLADALGSGALRADAVESTACGYLSAVVVAGLAMQFIANAWWIDGVSALVLVPFLVQEAKEAWEGDDRQ